MPRTTLPKTTGSGPYPDDGVALTMTAADTTNFNQFALTPDDILVIQNTDTVTRTYTIRSTPDPQGRTGDLASVSIAAGAIHVVGPFDLLGWQQPDGNLYVGTASSNLIKFGIYTIKQ
jgi:hypothetical protein